MTTGVGTIRALRSARVRILASIVLLLAASTLGSVIAIRQILLVRLDDRIESGLTQETSEFRRLVGGSDPATGRPFGTDVKAIFDTYLRRNVPGEGEVLLTFLGRRPYQSSGGRDFPVGELTSRYSEWTSLRRSDQGTTETSAGDVRYIVVPIVLGRRARGAFVVLNFTRGERGEVDDSTQVAAGVSIAVLLLASLAGWLAAGRVLAPLRELRQTAQGITESDLTRRIGVEGNDELAELGSTFNAMLDRLEAAFSTQRAFVNDASHELRTPITIIRGHLELMGDDADERKATVELVMDELDRMNRIVDDLLLLARADRRDFLHVEALDLADLAHDVRAKVGALAGREWRLVAPDPAMIRADRQRLTQAVMNLAQNAAQHTAEGDTIEIGVETAGGWARLWVADSGPGVPAADTERIFERFARAGGARRRSEGAGLGLSIVRAIAEAHGGRVELDTRPGAGATFTLMIPLRPIAASPQSPAPQAGAPA